MIGTVGFIGQRLIEAREARGLTATGLADLLGVSTTAISQYENGKHSPRPELMKLMAEKLNLPELFFKRRVHPKEQHEKRVYWRSFASATKTARIRCKHRLQWLEEIVHYLHEFLDFPAVQLPRFNLPSDILDLTAGEIEELASECRGFWGLKDGPIADVLLLLENNGIVVGRSRLGSDSLDAFSQWEADEGDIPYIIVGTDKESAVRSRYNACHELGHLLLHSKLKTFAAPDKHKLFEQQASRFAAAFLLPAKTFHAELWAPTLDAFRSLKERWQISIGVMIKRCEDLGVTNEAETQRLWINYSRREWRKEEPLDNQISMEVPRLLKRSFELLVTEGIKTKNQILLDLPYAVTDIEELAGLSRGYLSGESPVAEIAVLPKPQYRLITSRSGPAEVIDLSSSRHRLR